MRVWFVSTYFTESSILSDAEPGEPGYEYETTYEELFCSPLYATEAQAVIERNRMFMDAYEKERESYNTRLKRYHARKEAVELLALAGMNPEDLFPYGIGDEPQFYHPKVARIGYLEVVE